MPNNRISMKLKCPNPLFEEWLTEWRDQAIENDSKLQYCYTKALKSLRSFPLPLQSGRDCIILEGFGTKLCNMLDARLEKHRNMNSVNVTNATTSKVISGNKVADNEIGTPNKTPSRREYIPGYQTGAWAILMTMYKESLKPQYLGFMFKPDIIKYGQHLSAKSFIKPDPGSYYTAWSSIKTLLDKALVVKTGRPTKYSLTIEGTDLASKLYKNELKCAKPCSDNNSDIEILQNVDNNLLVPHKKLQVAHASTSRSSSCTSSSQGSSSKMCEIMDTETPKESVLIQQVETFTFEPDSFDIILIVDKMEVTGGNRHPLDDVIESELTNLKVRFEVRHLNIGDYTWICRERFTNKELVLPYIVERKRMDDFASSIKDGRFHEQKFRLKQCGIQNIVYLIESHGNNVCTTLPLNTLLQAAANTMIQDGFSLKYTHNIKATIKYFAIFTGILKRIYKEKTLVSCLKENLSQITIADEVVPLMKFPEFNKAASKNKDLRVQDLFVRQLVQLNGLSVDKALAIVKQYPTPQVLHLAYTKDDDIVKENLLKNFPYGNNKKIGPIISKTMYELFSKAAY